MMSTIDQLNQLRSDYTLVAVTGHRDLIPDNAVQTLMRERVRQKLTELNALPKKLRLLCPMAPGADQLVKEVADELKIPVVLLLPMSLSDYYEESFKPQYVADYEAVTQFVKGQRRPSDQVVYLVHDDVAQTTATLMAIERNARLVNLATVLATYSDHLLALWDGVDRGLSDGGTSHVVHMALSGQDSDGQRLKRTRPGQLHHLITPRRINPFPLSARHRAVHQPFPALPSLGELTWDVPVLFPPKPDRPGWWQRQRQKARQSLPFLSNYGATVVLAFLSTLFGYQGFMKLQRYEDVLKKQPAYWQNHLRKQSDRLRPGLVRFNTYWLRQTYEHPFWINEWDSDVFFKAANLNTLNSSVLGTNDNIPFMLRIGRWLGLFFLIYAFGLALLLAIGRERQHLLRFWWIRSPIRKGIQWIIRKRVTNHRFSLVIGLNDRSFNLISDLRRQRIPVVVLTADADSPYRESCEKRGVIYLTGLPYVTTSLRKSCFQQAERVYVMADSEENNIRAVQEMDQMWDNARTSNAVWYVQLENAMMAGLLQSFRPRAALELHIVNLYETIARRQLLNFPVDRFYPKTPTVLLPRVAQVAIFGFGPMAQALTLACLRLGHFAGGQRLRIRVYVTGAAEARHQFRQQYPCLSTLHDSPYHAGVTRTVRDTTFPVDVLTFEELPQSSAQLLNPDFSLFGMVNDHTALSVYGCLDQAMQSAALLRTLLPRLRHLRQSCPGNSIADVQVFGFYNLPDQDEMNHVMRQMNALAPGLPVSFFGNFLRECTVEAIHNQALNELGQAINWYYNKTGDPRKNWLATSEENRESSRQAGDHLWVKLRYARHRLNTYPADWREVQQIISTELNVNGADEETEKLIRQLSKLEHTRWNAEKLLLGYVALQDTDTVYKQKREPDELMQRWRPQKESYKAQRLQIDLIPFDQLDRYYPKEALKDKAQIEHLPDYLNALLQLDEQNRDNPT